MAAGRGSRLGSYTEGLPKTLLNIGDLTIFDRIVTGLDRIGIKDINVVIGYAGSRLQEHAGTISKKLIHDHANFEFIVNDHLDIGNIYSFRLAQEKMNTDFILVNSDVVFHHDMLEFLCTNPNDTALLVDDHKTLGSEEMKVIMNPKGFIKEITKELDPGKGGGEYIGIMKVSPGTAEKVNSKIDLLLSQQNGPLYYEDAFRLVAKEEDCLFACSTKGLPWAEVDTVEDMRKAKDTILPKIQTSV